MKRFLTLSLYAVIILSTTAAVVSSSGSTRGVNRDGIREKTSKTPAPENRHNSFTSHRAAPNTNGTTAVGTTTIVERGPHHKVVHMVGVQTNAQGRTVLRTNTYTELATGLHYQEKGVWKEAYARLEPYENGAAARYGQHKVFFASDLNTVGALQVIMPAGENLKCHVLGLRYFDPASGQTVLLATTTNSVGKIVNTNQVLYSDCFATATTLPLSASVRYTVKRSGLSQDVIIHELPSPEQFGLDVSSTRLQVLTEFLNPPSLSLKRQQKGGAQALSDCDVKIGSMMIGPGRAFGIGKERDDVRVRKELVTPDGRSILIEDIPTGVLRGLSSRQSSLNFPIKPKVDAFKAGSCIYPHAPGLGVVTNAMEVASFVQPMSGYLVDWELVTSQDTIVLDGNTTYLIADSVSATSLVIEGGAVAKFAPYAELFVEYVECNTSLYHPAFFTALKDDSIGVPLREIGDDSEIEYGAYAMAIAGYSLSDISIHDLRFRYFDAGIMFLEQNLNNNVRNCQFLNCRRALSQGDWGGDEGGRPSATVRNCLFVDCEVALEGSYCSFLCENSTFSRLSALHSQTYEDLATAVVLRNCILADLNALYIGHNSISGSNNGFHDSPAFGTPQTTDTAPFVTCGGGQHYLRVGSPFRNAGTTTIDPGLLASLKQRTTQPPIELPHYMTISDEMTLYPAVKRYETGAPDLGYHYDALDFTVAVLTLSGGTLRVAPGTSIGVRNDYLQEFDGWTYCGFDIREGSSLISLGKPGKRNTFCMAKSVQEASILTDESPEWSITLALDFWPNPYDLQPPKLDLQFTDFYVAQGLDHQVWGGAWVGDPYLGAETAVSTTHWKMRSCGLYGGTINMGPPVPDPVLQETIFPSGSIWWENCLFAKVSIDIYPTWFPNGGPLNIDMPFEARNNLFRNLRFHIQPTPASTTWVLTDNLFDKVAFEAWYADQNPTPIDHDYNGYWRRTQGELQQGELDRLPANDSDGGIDSLHDKLLTSAPPYQVGPLGSYYLAPSGVLFNGGSRLPWEAAMFHYTTRANQLKEGEEGLNTKINIGLHYVATANSLNSQPKDSDGDGIPDYVEDANGNGVVDTSETNPNAADSGSDPDGDNLTTYQEYLIGTNPFIDDSDADGLSDGDEDFDRDGLSNAIEFQLNFDPLNRCPIANPQSLVTLRNTPVNVTLSGWDRESNPVSFALVSQPTHGSLSGVCPNLVYTPASGYVGWDSFFFKAIDSLGESIAAPIHIEVKAPSPTPTANPQRIVTPGTPVSINLTGSSGGGGGLTFSTVSPPLHGTLSGTPPNLTYTPYAGYESGDYFSFKVNNGSADSKPALVTLIHNRAPVVSAGPDRTSHLSEPVTLQGTAQDDGVPSGSLSSEWSRVSGPGTVTFENQQSIQTTATFSSVGTYALRLTVTDSQKTTTDDLTVTIRPDSELIILMQPEDMEAGLGEAAVFAVVASGGGTQSYQWYHNGSVVGTDQTLVIEPVESSGQYYVVVSDGTTTLTSRIASLTLDTDSIAVPDGVVAWWRSENSSDSAGAHCATLNGVSFAPGKVGQAFLFDSSTDRATVVDDSAFALGKSLSIEGWIFVNSFSSGFIFVRGNNEVGVFPYYLSVEPGSKIRFYINSGAASDQLEATLAQGQWCHVAAVLDDATDQMSLYVNGQSVATKNTAVRPFKRFSSGAGAAIGIGNHPSTSQNRAFNGRIDELAVYSAALSPYQIDLLHNSHDGKSAEQQPRLPRVVFSSSNNQPIPASVLLSVPNFPDAVIYYTLNGQIPTKSTGTRYSGSIPMSQPTTVIAYATMEGYKDGPSTIIDVGYPIDRARVQGNHQVGVPNQTLLLPFVANYTSSSGMPVRDGQLVSFSARSPSGANITANLSNTSDRTGSLGYGYEGLVHTLLTLGDELGVYTVTANFQGNEIVFEAEAVSVEYATATDQNYLPITGLAPASGLMVSTSGQKADFRHTLGIDLGAGQGDIVELAETSPGSGVFVATDPAWVDTTPVFFSTGESGTKFASADFVRNPASYFGDSEQFESSLRAADLWMLGFADPYLNRGPARTPRPSLGGMTLPTINIPVDSPLLDPDVHDVSTAFLRSGGFAKVSVSIGDKAFSRFIPDQADILYISTHGYHSNGKLMTKDGWFSAKDARWDKGLDIVIIAGCSVLDVTGHKWGAQPSEYEKAPGREWAKTGPSVLLGYEGAAPIDLFTHRTRPYQTEGAPRAVIQMWFDRIENYYDSPMFAWLYANWWFAGGSEAVLDQHCWNACAITVQSQKTAYHFERYLMNSFANSFASRDQSTWVGEERTP